MPKPTSSEFTLKNPNYVHHCKIYWTLPDDYHSMVHWDRICSGAVELFGLPGQRYITDINENDMTWSFACSQDALLFKLKFSEAIIS